MWLALIIVPLLIACLFAVFQPYKKKWLNVVDTVAFILAALVTVLYTYHIYVAKIPIWVPNSFMILPFLSFIALVSYKIAIKAHRRCKSPSCCRLRAEEARSGAFEQEVDRMPENSPLINPLVVQ